MTPIDHLNDYHRSYPQISWDGYIHLYKLIYRSILFCSTMALNIPHSSQLPKMAQQIWPWKLSSQAFSSILLVEYPKTIASLPRSTPLEIPWASYCTYFLPKIGSCSRKLVLHANSIGGHCDFHLHNHLATYPRALATRFDVFPDNRTRWSDELWRSALERNEDDSIIKWLNC